MSATVLACDLGGSGFRAGLVDETGRVQARHAVPMRAAIEASGWVEADAEDWWRALAAGAEALRHAAPEQFRSIAAIAIAAFTRTQVLVGADQRALRPAILGADRRAQEVMADLVAAAPADHPESGQLNAFHPLARLVWLARHEPANLDRAIHVLEPKDYLNLRLTGVAAADHISSARLIGAASAGPGPSLLSVTGIAPHLLPPVLEPLAIVGPVRPGLDGALGTLAGVPVVAMANDTWASALGLGAVRTGFAYNLSGTTEVVGLLSQKSATAEGLLTVDWRGGLSHLGGPSLAGGDTLAWIMELIGKGGPGAMGAGMAALLARPRDPEPVLFLPFLQGERVPYWDPSMRGALVGLNRRHTATDLVWAAFEGIAFLNRLVLERAEAAAGLHADEVRFGGGGASNALWAQVKADVLGRDVAVVDGDETGLAGAAIAAWCALGRSVSLEEAQERLVHVARVYRPDAARRAALDHRFALFHEAERALTPLIHRLAGTAR